MDKTVSILIILFLMFGLILGTFFSAVQVSVGRVLSVLTECRKTATHVTPPVPALL